MKVIRFHCSRANAVISRALLSIGWIRLLGGFMIHYFERITILCVLGCIFIILFKLIWELECEKAEYRRQQNKRPSQPYQFVCLTLHLVRQLRLFFGKQCKKLRHSCHLDAHVVGVSRPLHLPKNGCDSVIHNSSSPNSEITRERSESG